MTTAPIQTFGLATASRHLTTGEMLLRAVVERPKDDAPRLIYADYLELDAPEGERDAARAEFIRTQIELARPLACEWMTRGLDCERYNADVQPYRMMVKCPACQRRDALRHREQELTEKDHNRARWRWGLGGFFRHRLANRKSLNATDTHAIFRRGFVDEIGCRTDHFQADAADLFSQHPITRVRLGDKEPPEPRPVFAFEDLGPADGADTNGGGPVVTYRRIAYRAASRGLRTGWQTDEFLHPDGPADRQPGLSILPHALFKLLPARDCETAEDAHANLSVACVRFGRAAAGLDPLPEKDTHP